MALISLYNLDNRRFVQSNNPQGLSSADTSESLKHEVRIDSAFRAAQDL